VVAPQAQEALERVRGIFLESRTRQKIPYFLDFLSLFQNSMKGLLPQAGLASKATATQIAQWQAKVTRSPAGVGLSLRKIRDFAIINIEYLDV
jgi:hypothetical protein